MAPSKPSVYRAYQFSTHGFACFKVYRAILFMLRCPLQPSDMVGQSGKAVTIAALDANLEAFRVLLGDFPECWQDFALQKTEPEEKLSLELGEQGKWNAVSTPVPIWRVVAFSSPVSVGFTARERTDESGAEDAESSATFVFVEPTARTGGLSIPLPAGSWDPSFQSWEKTSWTMCFAPDACKGFKKSSGCTALLFPSRILSAGKTHRFRWPTPPRKDSRLV